MQQKFISKPCRNFVVIHCFAGHLNHLTNQPLVTFSRKIDHHNKGNLKQRYNGSGAFRSHPNYRIFSCISKTVFDLCVFLFTVRISSPTR